MIRLKTAEFRILEIRLEISRRQLRRDHGQPLAGRERGALLRAESVDFGDVFNARKRHGDQQGALQAAGVLQAVLVPVMVEAVDRTSREEAARTAGAVLGAMLTLLAGIVAAGMIAAPWIMRALVSGVDDPAVADYRHLKDRELARAGGKL